MTKSKDKELYAKDKVSLAKERGERLQSLRGLSRLTRKDVEKKLKISVQTLNYWEQGLESGLSEKGAERVIAAFQSIGIYCSLSWLLYGTGSSPCLSEQFSNPNFASHTTIHESSQTLEEKCIMKELALFHELYPNAVHYKISDDGMLPFFTMGDYIAGTQYYHEEIAALLELNCIIETNTGDMFVRKLRAGTEKNTYNLCCVNSETRSAIPVLYNVKLLYAAPIIWHRKKNPIH